MLVLSYWACSLVGAGAGAGLGWLKPTSEQADVKGADSISCNTMVPV